MLSTEDSPEIFTYNVRLFDIKLLAIYFNSIEGFHMSSYQANFASHPTRDPHVGFLLHGRV